MRTKAGVEKSPSREPPLLFGSNSPVHLDLNGENNTGEKALLKYL